MDKFGVSDRWEDAVSLTVPREWRCPGGAGSAPPNLQQRSLPALPGPGAAKLRGGRPAGVSHGLRLARAVDPAGPWAGGRRGPRHRPRGCGHPGVLAAWPGDGPWSAAATYLPPTSHLPPTDLPPVTSYLATSHNDRVDRKPPPSEKSVPISAAQKNKIMADGEGKPPSSCAPL